MLQVLVCVKEELASVELHQDAGHGPYVRLLVPGEVLEDDLGCSILPRIDYQSVALVLIRRSSKVYHFNLTGGGFGPLFAYLTANQGTLTREIARTINLTALLTAVDAALILDLDREERLVRNGLLIVRL